MNSNRERQLARMRIQAASIIGLIDEYELSEENLEISLLSDLITKNVGQINAALKELR